MSTKISGLDYFTAKEIVELPELTESRWILRPLFPSKGKTIVYGAANDYKTWTMMDLALAYSSRGQLFHEIPLEKHGRSLFISVEGDEYDTQDRLTQFLRAKADINPGAVDLIFGHEPTRLNTAKGLEQIYQAIQDLRPGLVVLDPLRNFIPGTKENDSTEMSLIMDALDGLIRRFEFSLVIIHHANKQGGIRGSSALDGWATSEVQFLVERKVQLDGMEEPCDVITMHQCKARNAAQADDILLVPVFNRQASTLFYHVMRGFDKEGGDTPVAVDAAQRILGWWRAAGMHDPLYSFGFAVDTARRGASVSADKAKAGLLFLERRGLAEQGAIQRICGPQGTSGTFHGWKILPSTTDHIRVMLATMKRLATLDQQTADYGEDDFVTYQTESVAEAG